MGKVLKAIGVGVLLIGISLIPGIGPALSSVLGSTITSGAILAAGITATLGGLATLAFAPKIPRTQLSRLNVSLDTTTPRKAVFGTTAMHPDLRYHEASGTNQEYIDYIIVTSAHKVTSIDEIWFDDKKAWSASGGVTSTYTGYLTVDTRTEGTSVNTIAINGGAKWGSTRRLTGCSYIYLRIKRTGTTSKVESPLVQGLPSRITIRGNGALLYDPRKDSTVPGGSGSHRATDQTTWGIYTDPDDCDNPALQLLWWLLGWKINGVLSIGCGVPYTRIDMESFITAANICDENITLSGGGTQKRYRTSATASDADDRMDIINTFLTAMNGTLRDNSGKLAITVLKNDLANYVLTFNDDDVLDSFEWNQTRGLTETYNVARGRYVDPSDNSLYQLVDYPEVRIASQDGVERVMTVDLAYVEDGKRAQRIAKQVLQRNQYRGMFSATFTAKALGCKVGDIVRITFGALGWTNKLFRVVSQQIDFTGKVPMAMVEENAAIYAWDAEEQALVTPTAPTVYNPLNNPFILGINDAEAVADGKIVSFYQTTAPVGASIGDLWFDTDDGNKIYRWNGTAWSAAQDSLIGTAIANAADAQATADGKVNTYFQASAPAPEAIGDLWIETDAQNSLWRWNGASWVLATDTRVTAAIGTDGIIKSGKVVAASLAPGSINIQGYTSQSGLLLLAASDSFVSSMISSLVVDATGEAIVRFVPTFRLSVTAPVQTAVYSMDIELFVVNAATPTLRIYGDQYTVQERWDSPSSGSTVTLEQRITSIESRFTGLTAGTYNCGYRVITPSTNGAELPRYRYMNARIPRGDE